MTVPPIEVRRIEKSAHRSAHTELSIDASRMSIDHNRLVVIEFASCDEVERWLRQGLQSVAVARTIPAVED